MITPNTVPVSEENAAVHAIVLAFSADPAARWLYTNPHQYLTNFPRFVRAFAGAAFEQGSAECVEDYSGVALWLPPGIHSEEKALIELLQQTIPEPDQAGVFGVLEQMDAYHPTALVFADDRCRSCPSGQRLRLGIAETGACALRSRRQARLPGIVEPKEYPTLSAARV